MNIEVEAQLEALTEMCCDAITSKAIFDDQRAEALAKSLLMSGYERRKDQPLWAELEARIHQACPESAIHHGVEIKVMAEKVQGMFDQFVRWESRNPGE